MNGIKNGSMGWGNGFGFSLAAFFFFSCLACCPAQVEDIEQLARLSGAEYLEARDRLLDAQQKPIVLQTDAKLSWGAEMMTIILNTRIEHKEKFVKWDEFRWQREGEPRASYHRPHPLIHQNPHSWGTDLAAQCFLIEQIWKGDWYERNKREAVIVLLAVRILGSLSTWQRVYEGSDQVELRALALGALATEPSKWKLLQEALKKDQTSALERQAVFRGLAKIKSPRVREFVAETVDQWKTDASVAAYALEALAAQTDDQSRRDLYGIMMNKAMPMEVRTWAAFCMANEKRKGDAEYIEKLVVEAEEKDFPVSVVASIAVHYLLDAEKGLVEKILRTSKSEELILNVLRMLEFRIGKEDEYLLDILQSSSLSDLDRLFFEHTAEFVVYQECQHDLSTLTTIRHCCCRQTCASGFPKTTSSTSFSMPSRACR